MRGHSNHESGGRAVFASIGPARGGTLLPLLPSNPASRKVDDGITTDPHPMASTTRRLLLQSRQCPSRIRPRAAPKHTTTQWQRPLSTTPRRYANEPTKEGSATSANAKPPTETLNELSPELNFSNTTSTKDFKEMSQAERDTAMLDNLRASLAEIDPSVVADALRKGKRGLPQTQDFGLETDEDFDIEEDDKRKASMGFWAEGEESMGPDEDYYGDDLTSHGHGELQQHRELREYARLIAWELPLLSRTSLLLLNPHFILIKHTQISPNPSPHQPQQPPSASATPPTSANPTPPPTKSSSNSPPQTSPNRTL